MNHERFLDLDFTDLDSPPERLLTRRDLFEVVGGGILVLFCAGEASAESRRGGGRGRPQLPTDFNAFLRVGADGRVTCFTGKIEMGQGIVTSLAQMLAEELDVSLDSIDMVLGDTDLCPWDSGTFGSMSTRFFGPALQAAGAEARRVLLELAAGALGAPVEQLTVNDGLVRVKNQPGKEVSYAQLTKGQKIERSLQSPPPLKAAPFKVKGKATTRTDARVKVTGEAKYAADIRVPGMVYGKVLRPPAHGAKLVSVDPSAAAAIPGAQVVREGDFLGVVHPHPDGAERAAAALKAEFEVPKPYADNATIHDHLLKVAPEGRPAAQGGDLKQGEQQADRILDLTYLDSYVAHATMEPHTALVAVKNGKATVWASTQTPFRAKDEAARELGLPADQVRVITPFVGGGFGGKSANGQVAQAARLAKLTGKPVQVTWNRAEEFFYDTFRPAAIVKIRSGLTAAGQVSFWDYHVYFAGQRGAAQFYDIPHHATVPHGGGWTGGPGTHPFATGAWRAPGNNTNTFARESHMDELAALAGADPVDFRLRHLSDPKWRRVLQAATERFGWSPGPASSGRGFGCACGVDAGTKVAGCAEVEVDTQTGVVQVKRVVIAQDMGQVINPAGAIIQAEGCVTMGLGYALAEEVRFRGGEVLDRNFDTYELPRFSWLPKIETILIDNPDDPPQGGGEPAIILMGALVANAVFAACGARVRHLPVTPERVRAGLEAQRAG